MPRLNFVRNKIAAHDVKVELNTVKYTTASLYSDCLYFLWDAIKDVTLLEIKVVQNNDAVKYCDLMNNGLN